MDLLEDFKMDKLGEHIVLMIDVNDYLSKYKGIRTKIK